MKMIYHLALLLTTPCLGIKDHIPVSPIHITEYTDTSGIQHIEAWDLQSARTLHAVVSIQKK